MIDYIPQLPLYNAVKDQGEALLNFLSIETNKEQLTADW